MDQSSRVQKKSCSSSCLRVSVSGCGRERWLACAVGTHCGGPAARESSHWWSTGDPVAARAARPARVPTRHPGVARGVQLGRRRRARRVRASARLRAGGRGAREGRRGSEGGSAARAPPGPGPPSLPASPPPARAHRCLPPPPPPPPPSLLERALLGSRAAAATAAAGFVLPAEDGSDLFLNASCLQKGVSAQDRLAACREFIYKAQPR